MADWTVGTSDTILARANPMRGSLTLDQYTGEDVYLARNKAAVSGSGLRLQGGGDRISFTGRDAQQEIHGISSATATGGIEEGS